jgi:hypothetical protein
MNLHQLQTRTLSVEQLPRGENPVFETQLDSHQRIVGIAHYWEADYRSRKTVDHHAVVWVVTDLS